MRLFYQSVAPLGRNHVWNDYEKALVEHISLVKRPETQVELKGVRAMIPQATEYSYLEYLNVYQILDNAMKVEEEGYESFILGCLTDPGHDILRSALDIPVIFAGETSMHLACLIGKKFAFVARTERMAERIFSNVRDYGLLERSLSSTFLNISFETLARCFKDPNLVFDPFLEKCEELIAQGADVIIPGCGVLNVLLAVNKVNRYKGAVILDTIGSLVKVAEVMVELKQKVSLGVSRRGVYCSPGKEVMEQAKKALMKSYGD
jgi:allantoin racemase